MTTNEERQAALIESGWSFYHEGKYQSAIADLRQALKVAGGFWLVHYRLGFCYRALSQPEEALVQFREAARLAPEDPWTSYQIGKELSLRRRFRAALPELAATIRSHPMFPDAYHDAAACLANLGHFESATFCYGACAILCDIAAGEGIYTAVTTSLLESSSNQLKTVLGLKRYAAIQERLLATLGFKGTPKAGDRVSLVGFEALAREIVSVIGRLDP